MLHEGLNTMLSNTESIGADIGNLHQVPDDPLSGQQQDLHTNRRVDFWKPSLENIDFPWLKFLT